MEPQPNRIQTQGELLSIPFQQFLALKSNYPDFLIHALTGKKYDSKLMQNFGIESFRF